MIVAKKVPYACMLYLHDSVTFLFQALQYLEGLCIVSQFAFASNNCSVIYLSPKHATLSWCAVVVAHPMGKLTVYIDMHLVYICN